MIDVIKNFYRKCLMVDNSKLRVGLFIYDDMVLKDTVDFWSIRLKIPKNQFIKTQVLKSKTKNRKSKHGICNLYFSNTQVHTKILEWIRLHGLEMRE